MNCIPPLDNHPIHLTLPIAPQANHRLGVADDEKRPQAMMPMEAVCWLRELRKGGKIISSLELYGPGDPIASAQATLATLELLQGEVDGAALSVTCLGLGAAALAEELSRLGVTKVNLLVDTIDPETAAKLYAWIRPGKKTMALSKVAPLLIADQAQAVKDLSAAGIEVVVRTTVYQDINTNEIVMIAEKMATLGARSMELDARENYNTLIKQTATHLPTTQVGNHADLLPQGMPKPTEHSSMPKPSKDRPNVAVVSSNGMDVDMHLGQAGQVLIYGPRQDGLACLLETRATPPSGVPGRWQALADLLHDCFALLASHAGDTPRRELNGRDIKVILTEDNVEGLVDVLYGGGKKGKCKTTR